MVSYFKNRVRSTGKLVDTPTRLLNNSNQFLPTDSIEIPIKIGNNKDNELLTPRKEFKILKDKL